jgi:hypothetical protein
MVNSPDLKSVLQPPHRAEKLVATVILSAGACGERRTGNALKSDGGPATAYPR